MPVTRGPAGESKMKYFADLWVDEFIDSIKEKVLDVGAGESPLKFATHVIDYMDYDKRGVSQGVSADQDKFTKETWNSSDFYQMPWNYPDKFFDFVNCVQTLEDIRDPISVCREMIRVGNAGFIQCPNIISELNENFWHHRWFVRNYNGKLQFLHKSYGITMSDEIKKILKELMESRTHDENATGMRWQISFEYEEIYCKTEEEYNKVLNEWIAEEMK